MMHYQILQFNFFSFFDLRASIGCIGLKFQNNAIRIKEVLYAENLF